MTNDTRPEDERPQYRPYFIDPDIAEASRRSLSALIVSRLPYMCRQRYEDDQTIAADLQEIIDLIASCCSNEQDFLLPDTPMKEAIFRVLLCNSNEPMTAEEISADLSSRWPMTRVTSPEVIQRLLDNCAYYCISPMPLPETDEGA